MQNMFKLFWKKYFIAFLIGILPFFISTKVFFLTSPPVWPDEVIFTSLAKNFSEKGVIATNLWGSNEFGYDKGQGAFAQYPLYFILLGYWGKLFHFSIQSIRLLSVVLGFITLVICFLILIKLFKRRTYASIGIIMISTNIWFNQITHLGRMEILVIFFAASAYLFYCTTLKNKYLKQSSIIFLGLLSALALLTHPMGIFTPIAICGLMLVKDIAWKHKILYCTEIILLSFIPWCIWIFSTTSSITYSINQWQWELVRKTSSYSSLYKLFLSKSNYIAVSAVHGLLVLYFFFSILKIKTKSLFITAIPFLVTYSIAILGKEVWYLSYIEPWATFYYFSILVSVARKKNFETFIILFGIIILFINTISLLEKFSSQYLQSSRPVNYELFATTVEQSIPKNSSILVSSIPDPTFALWEKRGEDNIYQFFLYPMSNSPGYQTLLDTIDYVVINQAFEPILYSYLKTNTEKFERVQAGGYQIELYRLTAKNNRVHVSK